MEMMMSGLLIFAMKRETIERLGRERNAFQAHNMADVSDMLAILSKGGTAVARMDTVSTGYRIPAGCDVEFLDECPDEGPHRIQAEARSLRLYPHQEAAIQAMREKMADPEYRQSLGRSLRPARPVFVEIIGTGKTVDEHVMSRIGMKRDVVQSPFPGDTSKEAERVRSDEPEL